jgi:2-alkenal reductase
MDKKTITWIAGIGCGGLILLFLVLVGTVVLFLVPQSSSVATTNENITPTAVQVQGIERTQVTIPTLTQYPRTPIVVTPEAAGSADFSSATLSALYQQLNPGVVNITVYVEQQGMTGRGAGSGFILDETGHIVTNNHVVQQADRVSVVFFDGTESEAEIVGTDPDSDLAVIRVVRLPDAAHVLTIGNSDDVQVGEVVAAIGNPFGLGSSLSVGVVSAVGRTIPSGPRPFSIPQAIQTDAAINPGNSGGPLLNMRGEVIGVNAQIASGGSPVNAGVGLAIPANVVRRVAPVLIEVGTYQWPWLGIEGGSVDLIVQEANDLTTQQGAYIHGVVPDSPADEAGLQGSSGSTLIESFEVPTGGDVVTAADGKPVADFSDLLLEISLRNPGDTIILTIMRDSAEVEVQVELAPRPE